MEIVLGHGGSDRANNNESSADWLRLGLLVENREGRVVGYRAEEGKGWEKKKSKLGWLMVPSGGGLDGGGLGSEVVVLW